MPSSKPDEPMFSYTTGPAQVGLTKLELFAAMAMQGMAASPHAWEVAYEKLADYSVAQAKALIAALEKEQVRT